jgi:hypothetical protein
MTLLFMDSFDHYVAADLGAKYNGFDSGVTYTIGPTYGRNGSGISQTAGISGNGWYRSIPTLDEVIVGIAVKRTTGVAGTMLFFFPSRSDPDGRAQIAVGINASSQIIVIKGTSSYGFSAGTTLATSSASIDASSWNYIEVKLKCASAGNGGYVKVAVNGNHNALFIDYSGDTYNPSAIDTNIGSVVFFGRVVAGLSSPGATTATYNFDDIYICDTLGGVNNDMLGDVVIEAIFPDGAGGNTDWVTDDASPDNYAHVNEHAPDGDTTYVETRTIGDKDSYPFDDMIAANVAIPGIQISYYCIKTDSGGALYKVVQREAGVDHNSTQEESVPTSYGYQCFPLDKSLIDGNDWSVARVNSIEAGMERTG